MSTGSSACFLAPPRPQPLAKALAKILDRAEPPICVGLYARWGSGKSFMISLLVKELDPGVKENPHTRKLTQFFEDGYERERKSTDIYCEEKGSMLICTAAILLILLYFAHQPHLIANTTGTVIFLSCMTLMLLFCGLLALRGTLGSFIPAAPYWVSTLWSILKDLIWSMLNDLVMFATPCAKTSEYELLSTTDEPKNKKEYVFVHFNAWECMRRPRPVVQAVVVHTGVSAA